MHVVDFLRPPPLPPCDALPPSALHPLLLANNTRKKGGTSPFLLLLLFSSRPTSSSSSSILFLFFWLTARFPPRSPLLLPHPKLGLKIQQSASRSLAHLLYVKWQFILMGDGKWRTKYFSTSAISRKVNSVLSSAPFQETGAEKRERCVNFCARQKNTDIFLLRPFVPCSSFVHSLPPPPSPCTN